MAVGYVDIPFGEWLPDLSPLQNEGLVEAKNCIPLTNSYGEFRQLEPFTNALDGTPIRSYWTQDRENNVHIFAADNTHVYKIDNVQFNAWDKVSKDDNGYASGSSWEFIKFGDRVIAFSDAVVPQYYDLNVSERFADLPNAPRAHHGAVVRDFIVTGHLEDEPNVLHWSGFNSSELWEPSLATQSDRQTLFGRGGVIHRIVPGDYGIVFQENSIRRMDYVGGSVIFRIDELENERGTQAPYSVCWQGKTIYYYGHDDFYIFDGVRSTPLGANKVARWFQRNVDTAGFSTMQGVIDRQRQLVFWVFKSNALLPYNDRIIVYNWTSNRWSYAEMELPHLNEFLRPPLTLDSDSFNMLYDNSLDDDNQRSFDDVIYQGNRLVLVGFDNNRRLGAFTGEPLEAVFITSDKTGRGGKHLVCNGARPLVDGAGSRIRIGLTCRENSFEQPEFFNEQSVNDWGEVNLRKRGRFLRFCMRVNNGYNHVTGLQAELREGGLR